MLQPLSTQLVDTIAHRNRWIVNRTDLSNRVRNNLISLLNQAEAALKAARVKRDSDHPERNAKRGIPHPSFGHFDLLIEPQNHVFFTLTTGLFQPHVVIVQDEDGEPTPVAHPLQQFGDLGRGPDQIPYDWDIREDPFLPPADWGPIPDPGQRHAIIVPEEDNAPPPDDVRLGEMASQPLEDVVFMPEFEQTSEVPDLVTSHAIIVREEDGAPPPDDATLGEMTFHPLSDRGFVPEYDQPHAMSVLRALQVQSICLHALLQNFGDGNASLGRGDLNPLARELLANALISQNDLFLHLTVEPPVQDDLLGLQRIVDNMAVMKAVVQYLYPEALGFRKAISLLSVFWETVFEYSQSTLREGWRVLSCTSDEGATCLLMAYCTIQTGTEILHRTFDLLPRADGDQFLPLFNFLSMNGLDEDDIL
jgi:hypothetical protein